MDLSVAATANRETSSSLIHSSIPEIRIRKGSDAPSICELKGTAPLASFESECLSEGTSDLEDIDGEKDNTFSVDYLDRVISPTLDIPADLLFKKKTQEYFQDASEDNNGQLNYDKLFHDNYKDNFSMDEVTIVDTPIEGDGEITPCASPPPPPPEIDQGESEHLFNEDDDDSQSLPAPPSKSPSLEEKAITFGDSGVDDNFDTEDSEPAVGQCEDINEDAEETVESADETVENTGYEVLDNEEGGDDPFDLSYIEQKCASEILGTTENEGNTTPVNLDKAEFFMLDTSDKHDISHTADIFTKDTCTENTVTEEKLAEEDKNVKQESAKIKISIPNFKSRPKSPVRPPKPVNISSDSNTGKDSPSTVPKIKGPTRPPPPSAGKPGRPPPPNSKPPPPKSRPPPPKQSPRKNWETFEGSSASPKRPPPPKKSGKKGEGDVPNISKDSFDDEAAMLDSADDGKKHKSKGLKPGKALKGLVGGKSKEKKEKKEKQRQHQKELMSKFVSDSPGSSNINKENSEEWKKYQELLGKTEHDVQESKEKLTKMEAGFQGEIEKLWGLPANSTSTGSSPWCESDKDIGVSPLDAPIDEKSTPKVGWVGFEDDFSSKATGAVADTSASEGTKQDDLLGLGASLVPENQENSSTAMDLLGGFDDNMLGETNQPEKAADTTDQGAALGLLGNSGDNVDLTDNNKSVSCSGTELVDDFLGISSSFSSVPKVKDPLEELMSKSGAVSTDEQKMSKSGLSDVDEFLGITSDSNENKSKNETSESVTANAQVSVEDIDDAFGFGSLKYDKIAPVSSEVKVTLNGDLFDIGDENTNVSQDPFMVDLDKITKETEVKVTTEDVADVGETGLTANEYVKSPVSDDFDPRADISEENLTAKPMSDTPPAGWSAPKNTVRARPRPKSGAAASQKTDNPFTDNSASVGIVLPKPGSKKTTDDSSVSDVPNPFADKLVELQEQEDLPCPDENNKEANVEEATTEGTGVDSLLDFLGGGGTEEAKVETTEETSPVFNPFETIIDEDENHPAEHNSDDSFDPFQTIHSDIEPAQDEGGFDPFASIHGEDAFVAHFPETGQLSGEGTPDPDKELSPQRVNPFNKEPPLDEKFANFESKAASAAKGPSVQKSVESPKVTSESSFTEEEEELEPLELYLPKFEGDGWSLYLRLPTGKKKITQNRYWKPVYVRLLNVKDVPTIRIFNNDKTHEVMQELPLLPSYNICNMGLQQYDQFGKCHTVKIQNIVYRETVGMKAERIAPTLGDIARLRDFKGLKDLVHKPKTTMILDHAPQTQELFKFGSASFQDISSFIQVVEDAFFHLKVKREKSTSYTKDEITVDVVDEYSVDLDKKFHVISHKARVRMFVLAFLSGLPIVEVGVNDKRRRGKEIVGRHDIIPIKTEEWIRIEQQELNNDIDMEEFEKTKSVKFKPLDATRYEIMRFRVRPQQNKELPLQIRVTQSLIERHYEIRAEVLIPGFYSNSRKAAQTPCEDISIRFPIPEPWIYYFRVEKHFRYGSMHSSLRKPGKIKGLERLTMIAKGILPPSLIEVSAGMAKYENLFKAIVWRIPRLPERNEGAYKMHLFTLRLDLGPHDPIPTSFDQYCYVEFNMPNSTVSRAQVRSVSINNPAETPPDRWVHHLAKYQYRVEMTYTDQEKKTDWEETEDLAAAGVTSPTGAPIAESEHSRDGDIEGDSDSSDTDSD